MELSAVSMSTLHVFLWSFDRLAILRVREGGLGGKSRARCADRPPCAGEMAILGAAPCASRLRSRALAAHGGERGSHFGRHALVESSG
jgi:hypothetical protein